MKKIATNLFVVALLIALTGCQSAPSMPQAKGQTFAVLMEEDPENDPSLPKVVEIFSKAMEEAGAERVYSREEADFLLVGYLGSVRLTHRNGSKLHWKMSSNSLGVLRAAEEEAAKWKARLSEPPPPQK